MTTDARLKLDVLTAGATKAGKRKQAKPAAMRSASDFVEALQSALPATRGKLASSLRQHAGASVKAEAQEHKAETSKAKQALPETNGTATALASLLQRVAQPQGENAAKAQAAETLALAEPLPKLHKKQAAESVEPQRRDDAHEVAHEAKADVKLPIASHAANRSTVATSRPQQEKEIASEPVAAEKPVAVPGAAATVKAESKPAPAASRQPAEEVPVKVTVTRVETSHVPMAANATPASSATAEVAVVARPSPALRAAAPATVVKSMQFELQPDHLGDVKVSLHLKGEELRITVEVRTPEAHALLQRDRRILKEMLEHTGYEVAERNVTVTLRADTQPLQQAQTSNESFQFNRSSGGETSQQATDGREARQQQRNTGREERHEGHQQMPTAQAQQLAGGRGIYL